MRYISSDTNIWLDFQTISRTDLPFRLPCTYIMYREALREEVISHPELLYDLQKFGLLGVDISTEEFFYAQELAYKYVKLSKYDRLALAIARHRSIPLLTDDMPLRKAAIQEGVDVLGTIGLLDKLYEGKYVNKMEYDYCLRSLLEYKERRLPADELEKEIKNSLTMQKKQRRILSTIDLRSLV